MEKVTGRSDDMMIVRGVNVFPTQIEEQLLKVSALAPHYQIELTRDNRLDVMTIKTEASPAHTDAQSRTAAAAKLAELVKGVVGISAQVDVSDPGGVERSMGKARRVIDSREG